MHHPLKTDRGFTAHMKAIRICEYGGTGTLKLEEVPRISITNDQVLVRNSRCRCKPGRLEGQARLPEAVAPQTVRVLQFGPPSVIINVDLPRPEPAAGQLLVRVKAAGVGNWGRTGSRGQAAQRASAVHADIRRCLDPCRVLPAKYSPCSWHSCHSQRLAQPSTSTPGRPRSPQAV